MKRAFYFILGIALVILTSATTMSVITVKPAKPKATIVLDSDLGASNIRKQIYHYIKEGYIVKSIAGTSQYGNAWIVVMEKY